MPKTVILPNAVYADLEVVTKELAAIAKKPLSMSMAIYLLTTVYRAYVSEPCARDAFKQSLANSDLMSPEEFEEACDIALPAATAEKPKPKAKKKH